MRVAGVDGCPGGWVAVVLDDDGPYGLVTRSFAGVLDAIGDCACVAVDMPIGLPASGLGRAADREARAMLGRAGARVFPTPSRQALAAPDYAAARAVEPSLSAQSFALGAKILEVDASGPPPGVVEVHPDLAFAVLAGAPLSSKKRWNGAMARLAILSAHGIVVPSPLVGGDAGIDDAIDAAACALVARLHVGGRTRALGDPSVGVIWAPQG